MDTSPFRVRSGHRLNLRHYDSAHTGSFKNKQKASGRTLGTMYALVSIGGTVLSLATGGAIGVFGIVFLIYPLLTLVLVNTSFKNDLTN